VLSDFVEWNAPKAECNQSLCPSHRITLLLINRSQARFHAVLAIPVAVLTLLCLGLYAAESLSIGSLVGGGSASGLLCGIFAGSIIAFEMLLWPRKHFRRLRLIPAKYWMSAHIWLGIASLPLAIVHCGFHLGGVLPTVFMALFVLTCLSGFFGLAVQNILPRWMLRNLPAETIYSQIDYVSEHAVDDLERMILVACGRQLSKKAELFEQVELGQRASVVVGSVRETGRTRGRTLKTMQVAEAAEDNKPLWVALSEVKQFLLHGKSVASPVTDYQSASVWFSQLRENCSERSGTLIDAIEDTCDQRRQFDIQRTVHRWLHAWLPIHIALSIVVTFLLFAHGWTALKYW
jgi:hypothetical protein